MTNEFKGTLFTCPEGSRTSTAVYYVLNHKYDEYMLKLESMIGIDELIKVHAIIRWIPQKIEDIYNTDSDYTEGCASFFLRLDNLAIQYMLTINEELNAWIIQKDRLALVKDSGNKLASLYEHITTVREKCQFEELNDLLCAILDDDLIWNPTRVRIFYCGQYEGKVKPYNTSTEHLQILDHMLKTYEGLMGKIIVSPIIIFNNNGGYWYEDSRIISMVSNIRSIIGVSFNLPTYFVSNDQQCNSLLKDTTISYLENLIRFARIAKSPGEVEAVHTKVAGWLSVFNQCPNSSTYVDPITVGYILVDRFITVTQWFETWKEESGISLYTYLTAPERCNEFEKVITGVRALFNVTETTDSKMICAWAKLVAHHLKEYTTGRFLKYAKGLSDPHERIVEYHGVIFEPKGDDEDDEDDN